ncbi:hypothetical protein THOM_1849 [Trachipleistophora hominis]|uniref:Uncharacterized protein n=1 Tax=Trachipleistophora hominis TaxID=72359 RepID=L7JW21_TRAHO|nr:hypothetical protein THOM_1849 [Trachipleistophora hominis]
MENTTTLLSESYTQLVNTSAVPANEQVQYIQSEIASFFETNFFSVLIFIPYFILGFLCFGIAHRFFNYITTKYINFRKPASASYSSPSALNENVINDSLDSEHIFISRAIGPCNHSTMENGLLVESLQNNNETNENENRDPPLYTADAQCFEQINQLPLFKIVTLPDYDEAAYPQQPPPPYSPASR